MSVARHTAYNLIGAVAPIAVSIITLPLYLQVIGANRFGILAIFWTITGSLGFLTLGMGPALTQMIAGSPHATPAYRSQLFWTALLPCLAASIIGFLLVLGIGHLYFGYIASAPSQLESEIADALPFLGASIPLVLVGGVVAGALQGRSQFLVFNLLQTSTSVLSTILPLLCAWLIGPELPGLVLASMSATAIGLIVSLAMSRKLIPILAPGRPRRRMLSKLLRFGGWVSLTSLVAPILMTVDRLLIGALRGPAAVTGYVIPFSFVQRLLLLPVSLTSALFPRMSSSRDADSQRLQEIGLDSLAALLTPAAIGAIAVLGPFLHWWLGRDIAQVSTVPGLILVLGFWVHGVCHVASIALMSRGRPDLITKLLLSATVPYLALLYLLTITFGITGSAVAWTVRVLLDSILFFWAGTPAAAMRRFAVAGAMVAGALSTSLALSWHSTYFWVANGFWLLTAFGVYHRFWASNLKFAYRVGTRSEKPVIS
jgi:O-antigen/teichoic acid export membrane protein